MQRTKDLLSTQLKREDVDKDDLHQAICLDASDALIADLVSVWIFDDELTQIDCLCCYDALAETFTSGQTLKRCDFPTYFSHIIEQNIICAPDARNYIATKELTEQYFTPMGVLSLLDFILHDNYRPIGVICCENRTQQRYWTEENRNYLRSIASLASFRFKLN